MPQPWYGKGTHLSHYLMGKCPTHLLFTSSRAVCRNFPRGGGGQIRGKDKRGGGGSLCEVLHPTLAKGGGRE